MSAALAAIAVFPVLTLLLVGLSKAEGLLYAPVPKTRRTEPVYEPAPVAPAPEPEAAPVVAAPAPAETAPAAIATPAPETRPLPRLRSVQSSSLRKISLSSLDRVHVEA